MAVRKGNVSASRMTTEREPGFPAPPRPEGTASAAAERTSGVTGELSVVRKFLNARSSSRFADRSFAALMLLCACSIFLIVLFIFVVLTTQSKLSLAQFGWRFFTRQAWDPVSGDFGALAVMYGTQMTAFLALLMAVPLALGVAVFLTELCPTALRAPISFLT